MRVFHICTIANKLDMYKNMKESFIKAGFTEDKCRYSLFDNSKTNIYEPYSVLKIIQSDTIEPYIILCHQDILINQGDGFEKLLNIIKELEAKKSNWAILGNAGMNYNYELVYKIAEPHNLKLWDGEYPQSVHYLDENFLVINNSANFSGSNGLSGFHVYGTDFCLNAILQGYSCYVIDFFLTHLSAGNRDQSFWNIKSKFQTIWNNKFDFCYVTVNGMVVFLSKHNWLHFIFTKYKMKLFLLSFSLGRRLMSYQIANHKIYQDNS